VFVNLWADPRGHPLTYTAVYDLVRRLRHKTGIDFDPHSMRHTTATRWLRDGIGIAVVAQLLGHAHVATTSAIYGHLTVDDARRVMEQAGWFIDGQVRL
jgi:site-specific recombinase XerD